ncbi:MAG: type II toxin-antitoxin system HicA family toxin [Methanocorpusculum sp.]|nr:type II toxin-antitoxin system HicA family toxin [Methanocorpusculum sp.]
MKPVNRQELIRRLRRLGFEGPFSGGRHSFMKKDQLKLRIPNPHMGDIDGSLLKKILKQANVSKEQWEEND